MSDWRTFARREQLDRELAQQIAACLKQDIEHHGAASLAVSGGNTPKAMFQHLSNCELAWSKVDVMLVDERWVAPDSDDSNERLVRENLLHNRASDAQLHGLKTSDADPENALAELHARLAHLSRPFSVVVLGMGADGHTASWFPQASNLRDLLDPLGSAEFAATDPISAPHRRITLTLSAVLNSRNIFIHITGDDKKAVLEGAADAGAPVAAILEQTITPVTIWWAPR